jgi:hypothetical protein
MSSSKCCAPSPAGSARVFPPAEPVALFLIPPLAPLATPQTAVEVRGVQSLCLRLLTLRGVEGLARIEKVQRVERSGLLQYLKSGGAGGRGDELGVGTRLEGLVLASVPHRAGVSVSFGAVPCRG